MPNFVFSAVRTLATFASIAMLSGCGHSASDSISEAQPTTVVQPIAVPAQSSLVQPLNQPVNQGVVQPDGSVNYDQPGDRNVTVNAPLSDTKVDRDTGSIHIDAPFVHIDKAGRGHKTHIEIGGDSADNSR